jgi:ribonuclease J
MTTLTFYGGVNEIGGNKILLEDKDTKILMDFGKGFSKRSKYYEEFLKPRPSNGLKDFLTMGLVPDIRGVYRDDLLEMAGMKAEEPDIDAAIVTHAHADHVNYCSFLHEDIPLYMGNTCHLILQALEERSNRDIEDEILNFKRRPIQRNGEPVKRDIRTFRTGDKLKIGSLEVEPVHVDHSIPGAYGLVVHTSNGAVVYTGDIRLHGSNPKMTKDFVEKAKEAKPIALITEGTRVKELNDGASEPRVKQSCSNVVANTNKLVIVDFSFKDVDRFRTFYTIAKENNRKLVIPLKEAFLLKWLSKDKILNVPNLGDDNIVVHIPKQKSGTYVEQDYGTKEREFLNLPNAWRADKIKDKQCNVICAFNFFSIDELLDIGPEPNSIYIHSASEPYNEEMEIDSQRLQSWLELFKLSLFQSHCSGHAFGDDLFDVARQINAKTIFPVHTECPQSYHIVANDLVIVEEGKRYDLGNTQ